MTEELKSELCFSSATYKSSATGEDVFDHTTRVQSRKFTFEKRGLIDTSALASGALTADDPDLTFGSTLNLVGADKLSTVTLMIKGQSLPIETSVGLMGPDGAVIIPRTVLTTSSGLFGAKSMPASAVVSDQDYTVQYWLDDQIMQTGASLTLEVTGESQGGQNGLVGKSIWILAMPDSSN